MDEDKLALQSMQDALDTLRNKNITAERSEEARARAVTITELEKTIAYFKVYVLDKK